MSASSQDQASEKTTRLYASLMVIDGTRRLKPDQVSFEGLWFSEPPRLESSQVQVVLTNGDAGQRHLADVLPHEPDATWIPIRLVSYELFTVPPASP